MPQHFTPKSKRMMTKKCYRVSLNFNIRIKFTKIEIQRFSFKYLHADFSLFIFFISSSLNTSENNAHNCLLLQQYFSIFLTTFTPLNSNLTHLSIFNPPHSSQNYPFLTFVKFLIFLLIYLRCMHFGYKL